MLKICNKGRTEGARLRKRLFSTVELERTGPYPPGIAMLNDSWIDDLRAGRVDEALDQLRHNELLSDTFSPSDYYSLGAVYMWSGDYQSALTHFDEQIRARLPRNSPGDSTFGMAGAAAWCLGDEKSAIKYWRKGITAGYAVGGANTRTELFLYAASVLKPDSFSTESAEKLLLKKASHWRIKNWPGPIAQYILGAASDQQAREEALYAYREPVGPNPYSWQFEFYKLLRAAGPSCAARDTLKSELHDLLNVDGTDYVAGLKLFYFLRVEEFYLTRHWVSGQLSAR